MGWDGLEGWMDGWMDAKVGGGTERLSDAPHKQCNAMLRFPARLIHRPRVSVSAVANVNVRIPHHPILGRGFGFAPDGSRASTGRRFNPTPATRVTRSSDHLSSSFSLSSDRTPPPTPPSVWPCFAEETPERCPLRPLRLSTGQARMTGDVTRQKLRNALDENEGALAVGLFWELVLRNTDTNTNNTNTTNTPIPIPIPASDLFDLLHIVSCNRAIPSYRLSSMLLHELLVVRKAGVPKGVLERGLQVLSRGRIETFLWVLERYKEAGGEWNAPIAAYTARAFVKSGHVGRAGEVVSPFLIGAQKGIHRLPDWVFTELVKASAPVEARNWHAAGLKYFGLEPDPISSPELGRYSRTPFPFDIRRMELDVGLARVLAPEGDVPLLKTLLARYPPADPAATFRLKTSLRCSIALAHLARGQFGDAKEIYRPWIRTPRHTPEILRLVLFLEPRHPELAQRLISGHFQSLPFPHPHRATELLSCAVRLAFPDEGRMRNLAHEMEMQGAWVSPRILAWCVAPAFFRAQPLLDYAKSVKGRDPEKVALDLFRALLLVPPVGPAMVPRYFREIILPTIEGTGTGMPFSFLNSLCATESFGDVVEGLRRTGWKGRQLDDGRTGAEWAEQLEGLGGSVRGKKEE